jgi:preprotein translocase subunit SecA
MNIWKTLFGDESSNFIKSAQPLVTAINALEPEISALLDEDFPAETARLKNRVDMGESIESILPRAFALVREAAKRTLGMRHFDVQLLGGIALHHGNICEMRTGEGKTLVATLPAYLNALTGKSVHVITVNDYLARRDATQMGQIYAFLGLSTGIINDQYQSYVYDQSHTDTSDDEVRDELGSYKVVYEFLRPTDKKSAYACDIVYGTNSQFGFDYLRDNTVYATEQLSQKDHYFAIVDEVDSILIDEARVPLILSTGAENAGELYARFAQLARTLSQDTDYEVDEKLHAVTITQQGIDTTEKFLGIKNLYTLDTMDFAHHLENAIRAKALYIRDKDYVVKDGEVVIVDPFTGRMQEGRRWSDGLHQAVEAKEGVVIKQESRTMASITYQNYFKMYDKLAGMTGTGQTSKEEFQTVYGMDVIVIPTNKPIARNDLGDLIYVNQEAKFKAIAKKVKELHHKGQPVLIGTVSIERNELLSAYLHQEGVPHKLLNAKNHESEGEIIAMGGIHGAVTVATNMAGRGVDIKLGGPHATAGDADQIRELGGLYVIGTERHEARRIDNQLRGRSGRQGDPGTTQFYVSLDDDLMRVFGGERMKNLMTMMKFPEDEPIQNSIMSNSLEKAQDQIEGFHFDSRKHTLSYDDIVSKHRTAIYKRRRSLLLGDDDTIDNLESELLAFEPDLTATIENKRDALGRDTFRAIMVRVALQTLDRLWMEHLEIMDHTRRSVGLRAYGQREPLIEYAKEGLRLYRELETVFLVDTTHFLANIDIQSVQSQVAARNNTVVETIEQPNPVVNIRHNEQGDDVVIIKEGETRTIKRKKLQQWLDTGWKVVE